MANKAIIARKEDKKYRKRQLQLQNQKLNSFKLKVREP